MDVFEGAGALNGAAMKSDVMTRANVLLNSKFVTGSIMEVGNDGSRYMNEYGTHTPTGRHSHMYYHGTWANTYMPESTYIVFNQEKYAELTEAGLIPESVLASMYSGTAEEVCEAAGFDLNIFKQQITDFDSFIESGRDMQYGRDVSTMSAIGEGPYYVVKIVAALMNTQGGPVKNAEAQVIDVNDNPIPHLYVAGECGGVIPYQYQSGTNIAECMVFGQIAGRNAAAKKEPLATLELKPVKSNMIYLLGSEASTAKNNEEEVIEIAENEAIGSSDKGMGGKLVVKVTFDGEKIAAIDVLHHNETAGLAEPALKNVPLAIIETQSVEVDSVAGATMTSTAIKEAVQNAIDSRK